MEEGGCEIEKESAGDGGYVEIECGLGEHQRGRQKDVEIAFVVVSQAVGEQVVVFFDFRLFFVRAERDKEAVDIPIVGRPENGSKELDVCCCG